MDDTKLEEAKQLAWAQRERLNELVTRLDEQLGNNARPMFKDGTGERLGALRDIAADIQKAEELLANLDDLISHVRRYYPL